MDLERRISRRELLKVAALGGAATVLWACGARSSQQPTETGSSPEQTPEQEKSLPEQAKAKTLDIFTAAMKPQPGLKEQTNGQLSHYFKSDSNLSAWSSEIPNILNGGESSTVLKGDFIDADLSGGQYVTGEKTAEQVEINNIKVSIKQDSTSTLTDADRANGLGWKGIVGVDFIDRYRANTYKIGEPLGTDRTWAENFVQTDETDYPNFSSWIENGILFSVQLKGSFWEVTLSTNKGSTSSPNVADLFKTDLCVGDTPGCVANKFVP